MDVTTVGMFIGVFAILLGIFGLMWQMNRQSNRLEDAIDTQGRELRAEMQEQGRELRAEMQEQGRELRVEMNEQGRELRAEMQEQGARVSQAELDQARINGVNSVLLRHTHTHENLGDAD